MSNNGAYDNSPIKLPSPEDLKDELYTFTINPSDTLQFFRHALPSTRLQSFKDSVYAMLNSISNAINIDAYIEISKLGRLHLHGVCKIKDPYLFYMSVAHSFQTWCTLEIDSITDINVWTTYCLKLNKYALGRYTTGISPSAKDQLLFKTQPIGTYLFPHSQPTPVERSIRDIKKSLRNDSANNQKNKNKINRKYKTSHTAVETFQKDIPFSLQ